MKKDQILWIARNSIIAALYVALTLVSYPFSYGMIQFRISEVLVLLVCFNKKYSWGIIIGTMIANLFSFFVWDFVLGTAATVVALFFMMLVKNRYVASIFPVISNAIIVGLEIFLLGADGYSFLAIAGFVALGEAAVVCVLGNLVFFFVGKNKKLIDLISGNESSQVEE